MSEKIEKIIKELCEEIVNEVIEKLKEENGTELTAIPPPMWKEFENND